MFPLKQISTQPKSFNCQNSQSTSGVSQLSHLDRDLWEIVRVPQLGGHVELEVLGVLYGAVSQLDAHAASLLECLLHQQGLQDGVQLLSHVLQQHLQTHQHTMSGAGNRGQGRMLPQYHMLVTSANYNKHGLDKQFGPGPEKQFKSKSDKQFKSETDKQLKSRPDTLYKYVADNLSNLHHNQEAV